MLTAETMTVAKCEQPFPITNELGYVDITRTIELMREHESVSG